MQVLEFEKPIEELYKKIDELKRISIDNQIPLSQEITTMEERADLLKKKIYDNLEPIQVVQLARHPERPSFLDYVSLMFTDYVECHGDRSFGDDMSLIGGIAKLNGQSVMVIGQQKGKNTKDNVKRNFGMPHPEGYRKALRLMKLAEKFSKPIITFVDTPGAFPGLEAEERGQAEAIARNLREMAGLTVPVITIVMGEGGSGGALGIAVANRVAMLQYSVYSVISPEGCAAILWRDAAKANEAAKNLGITSDQLLELEVIDAVIEEPLGGCHNDHDTMAGRVKQYIEKELTLLKKMSKKKLLDDRYNRFRKLGRYTID
jgi:acetyl-CoA carboxylase carboxyl transferase subunit alpha